MLAKDDEVMVDDLPPESLEILLKHFYTDKLIGFKYAEKAIIAVEKFKVHILLAICNFVLDSDEIIENDDATDDSNGIEMDNFGGELLKALAKGAVVETVKGLLGSM